MIVMKFGGSSVGAPERIARVVADGDVETAVRALHARFFGS